MKASRLFGVLLLLTEITRGVVTSPDEERLLEDKFSLYRSAARPAINDTDTVNVTLGLTLSQIIDVHEKSQVLVISAFIRQIWFDPVLKWEKLKYNNISEINVDPKRIWKPDIVLYNNADEDKNFGGNLDRLNTRAILEHTGKITWLAPIIFKSQCPIDVKYFPFDTQHCRLKFGSWTYDKSRLNLLMEAVQVDISKYSPNSEWFLSSATANRTEVPYICCPGKFYPDVTYTITIARRSLFYLCNLIFPMSIIGMLTILSFLLPAESGERISLAITLLLAMTVFMLVVADIIPATSDVVPLVGVFFTVSMVEMVMMIIVICYVMRLHHKTASDAPMPIWMRKFFLDYLSYLLRIRKREKPEIVLAKKEEAITLPHVKSNGSAQNENQPFLNNGHINLKFLQKRGTKNELNLDANLINGSQIKPASLKPETRVATTKICKTHNTEADLLMAKIDIILKKLEDMDEEDRIQTEWRIVAMTIDRCLLMFFAAVYFITMVACFSKSPGYVP